MLRWQTTDYRQGIALAGQSVMPSALGCSFEIVNEPATSKAHRERWRT